MRKSLILMMFIGFSISVAPTGIEARQRANTAPQPGLGVAIERANAAVVLIETTRPTPEARGRRIGGSARHGSGFFIDSRGYILTNHHVIAGANSIMVTLHGGQRFSAALVGTDPRTDIAVLKIATERAVPVLQFANELPALADPVVALGSPLDFRWTATFGQVSGHGRAYDSVDGVDYLQHDAALNPGNSGGPLIDQDGDVIGVNTATPRETLFDIGIGLAIPAALASSISRAIIAEGFVRRGWLGLDVQPVRADFSAALGAGSVEGLAVEALALASPAALGGLQIGDLITSINGKPCHNVRDLSKRLLASKPADMVTLDVQRGGRVLKFRISLGMEVAVAPTAVSGPHPESPGSETTLETGLAFSDAVSWSRDGRPSAAIIAAVAPGSIAEQFGLKIGDGIVAVNRALTPDGPAAAGEIATASGAYLAILVRRKEGDQIYVLLPRTEAALASLEASGQSEGPQRGFL